MAGSVNRVFLIGNLGADPEIRHTQAGDPIANMRIATSETWRDKDTGERKERTEWHTVVVFNEHHAKFAQQYIKKGAKVYVEGQLQTRKWQDQSGNDRYTTEVVVPKFGGDLLSLDRLPSNRPPAADDPDAYGNVTTRESKPSGYDPDDPRTHASAGTSRQTRSDDHVPATTFDDDIPFAMEWRV